jgi:hypothetical protein
MGTVIISYSHDSPEHARRVLVLANWLRKDGVDCILDQYETSPAEGWPKWMDRHLTTAEYVIVICTKTYCQRVRDEEPPGKGKGVEWESTLTYQQIYDNNAKNTRFIPVEFDPGDCQYIPAVLKRATFYCVNNPDGYDNLYRHLTRQPKVVKPELGTRRELPPQEVGEEFPGNAAAPGPAGVKVSLSRLPVTGERLFGREEELKQLDEAWVDAQTRIVVLVAWGGVGKTALVNYWLNRVQADDYGGARRAYGWSFYSQGAAEGKQASADEFFQETLAWFGDAQPGAGSGVEKGRRLARLAGQQKSLVILDGLESLQYPPGDVKELAGKLKDPGLASFLKELAAVAGGGLCVITTRQSVADLAPRQGFAVKEIPLEQLPEAAGVELLKSLGVTTGAAQDFRQVVTEYNGHALALTLLGNYIKSVHQGDLRKRDEIKQLTNGQGKAYLHAGRVMAAYEKWFGPSPQRDILYLLGLFDRPAEPGAIAALRKAPAIPGVTDRLQNLSERKWQWALSHLRAARLVAAEHPQKPDLLDCHPMVREYLGTKLEQEKPAGWRIAHERLYRYYKDLPGKNYPTSWRRWSRCLRPWPTAARPAGTRRRYMRCI